MSGAIISVTALPGGGIAMGRDKLTAANLLAQTKAADWQQWIGEALADCWDFGKPLRDCAPEEVLSAALEWFEAEPDGDGMVHMVLAHMTAVRWAKEQTEEFEELVWRFVLVNVVRAGR